MRSRDFDLVYGFLRVEAEEDRLIDPIARIFANRAFSSGNAPDYRLRVERGTPQAAPDGATILYSGPLFEDGDCVFAEHERRRFLFFPGVVSVVLEPDGREATITVAGGHENRAGSVCAIMALQAAASATDQFMLHAAGLTLPGEDGAILIFGQSGAGKTTTTLALCAAGFGLYSDDVMFVRPNGGGPLTWGLPRILKVHRKTADMLGWVAPLLTGEWSSEDEKQLRHEELQGKIRLEPSTPRRIAALFKLERSGGTESAVTPIGQAEALAEIAADNVKIGDHGLPGSEARQFGAIAALVRATPVFRLSAGRDLDAIAPAVLETLRGLEPK